VAILFILTIFSPVSTTIFQTFNYDTDLGDGSAYLKADYTIEYHDDEHKFFRLYAVVTGLLYCAGIPLVSLCVLIRYKSEVKALQVIEYSRAAINDLVPDEPRTAAERKISLVRSFKRDSKAAFAGLGDKIGNVVGKLLSVPETSPPDEKSLDGEYCKKEEREQVLRLLDEKRRDFLRDHTILLGLSPLYADYEAEAWWWQILTFVVTLLLCGPLLLLPAGDASKVFLQLLLSCAMSVALANANPYIHSSDDLLAQLCQGALSLTMAVGLLEMAGESYQDKFYGPLLVACTTVQFVIGFVIAGVEWVLQKFPNTTGQLKRILFEGSTAHQDVHNIILPRRIRPSFFVGSIAVAPAVCSKSKKSANAVHPFKNPAPADKLVAPRE